MTTASSHPAWQASIDAIVQPVLASTKKNVGIAIGALYGEQVFAAGYGNVSGTCPSAESVYEIGSVTKVFTTGLLALLVDEGVVNLEDAIADLVPELAQLPKEITLLRLATHTAGLPRLPGNIWWSVMKNAKNPYAAYRLQDLYAYLKRYRSTKNVGKISYSNLGVGLLGHVLALQTGMSYQELVRDRLCSPLHLNDTSIDLNPDQQQRLIPGYLTNGKPAQNWDIDTLAGAGALRSTIADLLKFLAANLQPLNSESPHADIIKALQSCHETQVVSPKNPEKSGVGLGWFKSPLAETGKQVIWHNGGTGGYQSYVGFVKSTHSEQSGVGVAVLVNRMAEVSRSPKVSADNIGIAILQNFLSVLSAEC